MKKLLFIILTLFSLQSFAQDTTYVKVRGIPGAYNFSKSGDSLIFYVAGVRNALSVGTVVDLTPFLRKSDTADMLLPYATKDKLKEDSIALSNAMAPAFVNQSFDTSTRSLIMTRIDGTSQSVVIPKGTASGGAGLEFLSSSRTGNMISVMGDNGTTTTFSVNNSDSATRAHLSDLDNYTLTSKTTSDSTAFQNSLTNKVDKTTTVNGKALSSNITLAKSDVGLSNVDNTSDISKPVSTAMQNALNLKANDNAVVHNIGDGLIIGRLGINTSTHILFDPNTNQYDTTQVIIKDSSNKLSYLGRRITLATTDSLNKRVFTIEPGGEANVWAYNKGAGAIFALGNFPSGGDTPNDFNHYASIFSNANYRFTGGSIISRIFDTTTTSLKTSWEISLMDGVDATGQGHANTNLTYQFLPSGFYIPTNKRITFGNDVYMFRSATSMIDLGGSLNVYNNIYSNKLIKTGGTSSQFLKADGSVDATSYLSTTTAASTYEPKITKNTAFNKNFGTTTGTVMDGKQAIDSFAVLRADNGKKLDTAFKQNLYAQYPVRFTNDSIIAIAQGWKDSVAYKVDVLPKLNPVISNPTFDSTFSLKSFSPGYTSTTVNYTVTNKDYTVNAKGTLTITLPDATTLPQGTIYNIVSSQSGTVTINTSASQTFDNITGTPTTLSMTTLGTYTIQNAGGSWLVISKL